VALELRSGKQGEPLVQSSDERMARLVERLGAAPGYAGSVPGEEGEMIRAALTGRSVYEIAQQAQVSEETVWRVLDSAARMAAGEPVQHPVETGGFGSDTDPGVTGGYGETGFGSLEADIEPGDVDANE